VWLSLPEMYFIMIFNSATGMSVHRFLISQNQSLVYFICLCVFKFADEARRVLNAVGIG
jgi:hypothetical protein